MCKWCATTLSTSAATIAPDAKAVLLLHAVPMAVAATVFELICGGRASAAEVNRGEGCGAGGGGGG